MISSLALAGCGEDPPTPGELRTRIASDLGNVLREADASFTGGSDALPGAAAGAMVDRLLAGSAGGAALDAMLGGRIQALTGSLDHAADSLVDADAQVAYLNDRLFSDANHIGDGVYRVPASVVCSRAGTDAGGNPVETIDATCAAQLAKIDLRIRTANDDGAVVFAIQVDAAHDEPLRLTLTHTSLAITVDLDGAQHAFTALAGLLGETPPNAALAGQVTAKLEILGAAKARASLAIDRALAIAIADPGVDLTGPDALALSSAPGELFAVTLDGRAASGSLSLGLGETALKIPDDAGRLELDLPGATGLASFARGQPTVLSHVGLGSRSTTLSIGGARGLTIDLNPHDGRALDATLTQDTAGHTASLAVSPRLDLQVALD
ncbi:MAG TPA: hypothetical protein VK607_09475, partial [Kofleriaceae bacterium]|nr:hypothetical protein [Kofleriaceae bacterium]